MLAALLKLPRSMRRADKVARVDAVLKELASAWDGGTAHRGLELEGCQHTLVGDEVVGLKGISGGQRRRVSVGIELVKSPRVLFLDEPTSGLDSEMAVSLVDTLVALARQNRTVCTTIHQPNSYITSKFDDFMLLHAGSSVYCGKWCDSVGYFASHGCPCPQFMNPSDYFMSVLKERGDELVGEWGKQECGRSSARLAALEAGEAPAAAAANGNGAEHGDAKGSGGGGDGAHGGLQVQPSVPWVYQVYVLAGRMFRQWWRNPAMLLSEACQYGFMALFVGLVYLQLNNSLATGVNDRAASLWFAMAILSFTPSYTAVVAWDKDRLLLRRESQQGITALFCVVMYFMVGYYPSAGCFFTFLLAFCLFQLISESVGGMWAAVCGNSTYAILVLTFVLLFLLSFSDFLLFSYSTYAYAAVVDNEFTHVTFYTKNGVAVPGAAIWNNEVENSPLAQANNGLSVATNLLILLALTVGTRLMAFALIWGMARLRKL
ncbi:ABC transporter [Micractinium conductrix]|uniref:ABC transporter n=1 Tax=Micractinium conductrix TaxID=554055 RepID=A0A2P6VQ61_9CHLO|nr:ABC transporter [Micractinium conductrix]|eukprot:PSC76238.1 ABC transporter [Micractinium conductrix]